MANIVKKTSDMLPALMREVENRIVVVRGQKMLLDRDVAELYGVETREVNQAVRNNPRKFLEGYVIEMTKEESAALRSKLLTLETSATTLDPGKGYLSSYLMKTLLSPLEKVQKCRFLDCNLLISKCTFRAK